MTENDLTDEICVTELADGTGEWGDVIDQVGEPALENQELVPTAAGQFQPFPLEVLPAALSEFCVEQAKSICCDPTMVLLPALAAMAAAIGNSRRVLLRNLWSEPAILWTVCVAESGSGKSPAFRAATQPLDKLQLQLESELKTIDHDGRLVDSKDDPNEPTETSLNRRSRSRYEVFGEADWIGNAASESRGSVMVCEEINTWFSRLSDLKSKSFTQTLFLRAYEGRLPAVGREWVRPRIGGVNAKQINPLTPALGAQGRGAGDCLNASGALSITGTISQADLKNVLNEEKVGSAIIDRLLVAMPPEQTRHWSDDEVSDEVVSRYEQMVFGLGALPLASSESQCASPLLLELTPRARERFKNFYNKLGTARADVECSRTKVALAKVEGVAARIALIIACARFVMGEREREVVDERDIAAGIATACWFLSESQRIESVLAETPEMSEQRCLVEWIRIQGGSVGISELRLRRHRYRFGDSAEQALETLVKMGFGRWRSTPTTHQGGRPSRRFWLLSVSTGEGDDAEKKQDETSEYPRAVES